MDFLKNKEFLRGLLMQADAMNTVSGGVQETEFKISNSESYMIVEVSNPSVSPEAFNFTVDKNELLVSVMYIMNSTIVDRPEMFPLFYRAVEIPYNVDINGIEASFIKEKFKILLPYNNNLPKSPFRVRVKNRDN